MTENRLRELRKKRGLTLQQLADLVGTSNQQIQRLETGERRLSDIWIERLYKPLGCYPSELLPIGWQKPSDKIDVDLLSESLTRTNEFKIAAEKKGRKYSGSELAALLARIYETFQCNKPINDAEIIRLIRKDSD